MDTPVPQLQVGQQEQELRQLLNKDKSKRSKDGGLPGPGPWPARGRARAEVGATPARASLCLLGPACECGWGSGGFAEGGGARLGSCLGLRVWTGRWLDSGVGRPPPLTPHPP